MIGCQDWYDCSYLSCSSCRKVGSSLIDIETVSSDGPSESGSNVLHAPTFAAEASISTSTSTYTNTSTNTITAVRDDSSFSREARLPATYMGENSTKRNRHMQMHAKSLNVTMHGTHISYLPHINPLLSGFFCFLTGDMSRDDGELSLPLPLTTPAVRKMAKEMGIDLYAVTGSGPGGRILKEDLMNDMDIRVEQASQSVTVSIKEFPSSQPYSTAGPSSSSSSSTSPSSAVYREGERRTVPLRGLQRLMARSMTESLKIPQLSYSDDINCDKLVLLKEGMKASIKKGKTAALPHNASPSILPLIIKATSLALKKHPIMNCAVHCTECSELVYNDDHNIGK